MSKTIYVGNLPLKSSEAVLRRLCAPFGAVTKCQVIYQQHAGAARVFAFVTFSKRGSVDKAVSTLNNHRLGNRAIHVAPALPKGARPSRPPNPASFTRLRFRRLVPKQTPKAVQNPTTAVPAGPAVTPLNDYKSVCPHCKARVFDLQDHIYALHRGGHPPKKGNQTVGRRCPCGNPAVPGDDRCYTCMA